jgi:hypothetical protein
MPALASAVRWLSDAAKDADQAQQGRSAQFRIVLNSAIVLILAVRWLSDAAKECRLSTARTLSTIQKSAI